MIQYQILRTNFAENEWQTVRRIFIKLLEVNVLTRKPKIVFHRKIDHLYFSWGQNLSITNTGILKKKDRKK